MSSLSIWQIEENCRVLNNNFFIYANNKMDRFYTRKWYQHLVCWIKSLLSHSYKIQEAKKIQEVYKKTLEGIESIHRQNDVWLFPNSVDRSDILVYEGFDKWILRTKSQIKINPRDPNLSSLEDKILTLAKDIYFWASEKRSKYPQGFVFHNSDSNMKNEKASGSMKQTDLGLLISLKGGEKKYMCQYVSEYSKNEFDDIVFPDDKRLLVNFMYSDDDITTPLEKLGIDKKEDGYYVTGSLDRPRMIRIYSIP